MTYAPITFKVRILSSDTSKIGQLTSANRRQLLRVMGREFYKITMGTFGASGTNRASDWPPLTKRYQKRINYFGPPKLVLKGNLRSSIRVTVDNDRYAEIGTHIPYAGVHQFGGGNNIPARPYFPIVSGGVRKQLTPYAKTQIANAVSRELIQILKS